FLPADDPEIAMVIVIDEPQPIHLGGTVAAPIFSKIANQAVRCLDIPPVRNNRLTDRKAVIAVSQNSVPTRKWHTDEEGIKGGF
ncbi:MAG: hypothetical protein PHR77_22255, partial [Kiritimatiellae bacterium]|nr:hypothetical protein [Kiritimatiellia bacterium]